MLGITYGKFELDFSVSYVGKIREYPGKARLKKQENKRCLNPWMTEEGFVLLRKNLKCSLLKMEQCEDHAVILVFTQGDG